MSTNGGLSIAALLREKSRKSGADTSAIHVTPGTARAASHGADQDVNIDRLISSPNSEKGEEMNDQVDENEYETGSTKGSSSPLAIFPKVPVFNPFKVSEQAFNLNPESLGIPGINRYSTYDEYVKYIDSPEGIKEEYMKLMSRIPVPKPTTVVANVPVVSLKGVGMGYEQCKRFRDYMDSEIMAGRTQNRMSLIDPAARVSISSAFMAKKLIQEKDEWHSWDDKNSSKVYYSYFRKSRPPLRLPR